MNDRDYTIDSYNLFVQQQAASFQQMAFNAAQSALQANVSFAHSQNVRLHAIKNFEDLLASQKIGQEYKQKISNISKANAVQNLWALRKSADVNSRIIDEQGLLSTGELTANAAQRGVQTNTGSASGIQTMSINETNKLKNNNYREHASPINQGIDNVLKTTREQAIGQWSFEQQQDFMKKAFAESL